MARPLTPQEILRTFERWGVPFDTVSGWKTRSNSTGWSPSGVSGCMHHHTGNDASDRANRALVTHGHAALNGPLCNFGVTDTGRIDIVSAGAANHAGNGDPKVLQAVRAESYDRFPPRTRKGHRDPGAVGGNGKFYGWETYFGAGSDPKINTLQYRVLVLSTAAVIAALDTVDGPKVHWTGKSVIGHKEWQKGKPDPAGVDMSLDRDDVQWCLKQGPAAAGHWFATGKRLVPVH